MIHHTGIVALLSGLLFVALATAEDVSDHLIFPDPAERIMVVAQDSCDDSLACGHRLLSSDFLAGKVLAELDIPFHRSVIKVSQCLRNFVHDSAGPNVIYLSNQDGGYARVGIVLKDSGREVRYPNLGFVDLVLTRERLQNGDMDIYSHELGHVMMHTIWPLQPKGQATKMHVSMGITDSWVALSEGWGEHFQRLAYDAVPTFRDLYQDQQHFSRSFTTLWHSHLDTRLRLTSVPQNDYIHCKLLPDIDTVGMTIQQLITLEHTSPVFDPCRLKNAQEMLASEGVLATLFYRMSSDSLLQNSYADRDFYQQFLVKPLPDTVSPRSLFTPFENVLLKQAYVWSRIGGVSDTGQPMIALVRRWADFFPQDKEQLIKLFLLTTVGKTVSDDLGRIYEEAAYYGMIGNLQKYRELMQMFQQSFTALKDDVLCGRLALDAAVGPQLWVENPTCIISYYLFSPEPKGPLKINLNTAGRYDLASFPGVTLALADKILTARNRTGCFRSIDEVRQLGVTF